MVTIETEASIYEVEDGRIRRTTSSHAPTPNQPGGREGKDGDWKPYTRITPWPPVVGERIMIIWGQDGDILRRTETSLIQAVSGL